MVQTWLPSTPFLLGWGPSIFDPLDPPQASWNKKGRVGFEIPRKLGQVHLTHALLRYMASEDRDGVLSKKDGVLASLVEGSLRPVTHEF